MHKSFLSLSKSWFKWVYHPFLLGIYPILFFYSYNQTQLKPFIIRPLLIISLVTVGCCWGILALTTRSWLRSALMCSLLTVIFFSYGHIAHFINPYLFIKLPMLGVVIGPDKVLLPSVLVLVLIVAFRLHRTKKSTLS